MFCTGDVGAGDTPLCFQWLLQQVKRLTVKSWSELSGREWKTQQSNLRDLTEFIRNSLGHFFFVRKASRSSERQRLWTVLSYPFSLPPCSWVFFSLHQPQNQWVAITSPFPIILYSTQTYMQQELRHLLKTYRDLLCLPTLTHMVHWRGTVWTVLSQMIIIFRKAGSMVDPKTKGAIIKEPSE